MWPSKPRGRISRRAGGGSDLSRRSRGAGWYPEDDHVQMKPSVARRKGTYDSLLAKNEAHLIRSDSSGLPVPGSDRPALYDQPSIPLVGCTSAFALNAAYADNVVKVIVEPGKFTPRR